GSAWRIRTRDLVDTALAPEELADRVESHVDRPSGTGLVAWDDGRVLLADVEGHALRLASRSGQTGVVVGGPPLQGPDGLARGPEDWVYLTVTQLNLHPALNRGTEESRPPYGVLRVRVPRSVPVRAPTATPRDGGVGPGGESRPDGG